jgi:hypothetical protein
MSRFEDFVLLHSSQNTKQRRKRSTKFVDMFVKYHNGNVTRHAAVIKQKVYRDFLF